MAWRRLIGGSGSGPSEDKMVESLFILGIRTKFELLELSLLSSSNSNLALPLHESASPLPPKAPRTNQLGFLGPWVPMGAPLLPPLLLCPTPEYRPSRSPCQRGAWKAHICQYQPPLAHPTW